MRTFLKVCGLFVVLVLSSCSHEEKHTPNPYKDDIPSEPNVYVVEIKQMKFDPAEVRVHSGDKITWINHDIVTHDVTEVTHASWTSSPITVGSSWSMVAKQSDDYYCSIHVVMKGKIIVQ